MPTLRLLPELEEALRRVHGIRAASVVTGPDALPTEVHVLAGPGKAPKQVVRDVQSLALASYGITIDHRIVSVVQLGEGDGGSGVRAPAAPVARPKITAITVRTSGTEAEACVAVESEKTTYEGRAVGPAEDSERPRLVALAAVNAIAPLLGSRCDVEFAAIVATGSRDVALSIVTLVSPDGAVQTLTGSAIVRVDHADAAARSVLAALNRQLTRVAPQ